MGLDGGRYDMNYDVRSEKEILSQYLQEDEKILWVGQPEKAVFIGFLLRKEVPVGSLVVAVAALLTYLITREVKEQGIVMGFMVGTITILYILKVVSYYSQIKVTEMKAVFGVTNTRVLSHCEGRKVRQISIDSQLDLMVSETRVHFTNLNTGTTWSFWGLRRPETVGALITAVSKEDYNDDEEDIW